MKTIHIIGMLIGVAAWSPCGAATLLLDDFSLGGFSLAWDGVTSNSSPMTTPLTDQRTVSGVGVRVWSSTLGSGEVEYLVEQVNPSPGRNYLNLNYSSTGTFSILGYDAFAIDVGNVVGAGEFVASVDGSNGGDIRIPINGPGTVVSPFSGLDTNQSLDSLTQMNFRFYAISEDFSLTMDNVRIVPETSLSLLLLFGAVISLLQRRR